MKTYSELLAEGVHDKGFLKQLASAEQTGDLARLIGAKPEIPLQGTAIENITEPGRDGDGRKNP